MSSRVYFCDLCVILLFSTLMLAADEISTPASGEGQKGNCSCGGFPTSKPDAGSVPLLSQVSGLVMQCDDEGTNTCKNLCIALATAAKAKGPEVLCRRLINAKELKLSAFYKVCDKPWVYANMTAEEPLCCVESKVKLCPSMEKANTTKTIAM